MILAEQNFDLRTKSVPDRKSAPEEENQALADAQANAAFQKLYEATYELLKKRYDKGPKIPEWALGKALQKFLRDRGPGKVEKWKWLEGRETPLLDHLAPCHTIALPEDYEPTNDNHNRRTFASVPHVPPLEFWHEPITKQWQPVTATDTVVLEEIATHVLPTISQLGPQLPNLANQHEQANQYATWANGTKLDMIAWIRSCHAHGFQHVIENGSFSQVNYDETSPNTLYIPNVFDLTAEIVACRNHIATWIEHKKNTTFFSRTESAEYTKVIEQLMSVIECCRWRIDHDAHLPGLNDCLQTSYELLNQAITLNISDDDHSLVAKNLHHDLACLVAGGRADTNYANQPTIDPQFRLDYVDVFMLLAQQFTHLPHTATVTEYQIPGLKLFQHIDAGADSPQQLYACLLATYIRMDVSQRERYEPIIKSIFAKIKNILPPIATPEPLLYVPNTHIKNKKNEPLFADLDLTDPKNFHAALQRTQLEWIELTVTRPGFDAYTRRNHAKIDIRTTVSSDGTPKHILGENTSHLLLMHDPYWGSSHNTGYALTEVEAQTPLQDPPELAVLSRLEPTELLAAIESMPGLLSTKRLGAEFERMSNELIGRRAEAGSFSNVSEIVALIELLTTLTDQSEPIDFTEIILRISALADSLTGTELESDLAEILTRAKDIQATHFEYDSTTNLTLAMMATGLTPRELLVEFSFKAYDVLAKLLGITTATHLAVAEKARLLRLFGPEMADQSIDLSTAKTELQTVVKNLQSTHGYDVDLSQFAEFQDKVTEILDIVASLLNRNVVYDEDMHTGLRAIIAMQRTGRLEVQCSANADLLLSLAVFLSQEIPLYHASTYGDESLLTTDQWFRYISTVVKKKDYSHAFGQIDWPAIPGPVTSRYLVVDGTAGMSRSHQETARTWLPERAQQMKSGHAALGKTLSTEGVGKVVFGTAIDQGSAIIASLAIEAGQIDYAYTANPDDINTLLYLVTGSKLLTNAEKVEVLLKIISMEPKVIAKCNDTTYETGDTTARLSIIAELAIHNKLWSVACFAINVLRFSDLIKETEQQRADKLYEQVVTAIVNLPEKEYQTAISQFVELLRSEDIAFISENRAAFLTNQNKIVQVKSRIASHVTKITDEGLALALLQAFQKMQKPEKSLGDKFKLVVKKEVTKAHTEAVQQILGEFASAAASTRFEAVKLPAQVSALKTLLSTATSPAETEARLQKILQQCAAVSLEIATKDTKVRGALMAAETNQTLTDTSLATTSLQTATRQFNQFREGLQKAADELGLKLPELNTQLLLTATLNGNQLMASNPPESNQ